jgi:transcriptional regulator GlxA family with amidase domain
MSPRHFARVFRRQVGMPPAAMVEEVRVEAARHLLEVTDHGHARIAADCGFGTEETLRRVFHRVLRVAPAEYRQRFSRREPV